MKKTYSDEPTLEKRNGSQKQEEHVSFTSKAFTFPTELADWGKVGNPFKEQISLNPWQITAIGVPRANLAQHSPKTLKNHWTNGWMLHRLKMDVSQATGEYGEYTNLPTF